jgi:hypothetical protein
MTFASVFLVLYCKKYMVLEGIHHWKKNRRNLMVWGRGSGRSHLGIASNESGGFITEIDPGGLSHVKRRVCLILHCGPDD